MGAKDFHEVMKSCTMLLNPMKSCTVSHNETCTLVALLRASIGLQTPITRCTRPCTSHLAVIVPACVCLSVASCTGCTQSHSCDNGLLVLCLANKHPPVGSKNGGKGASLLVKDLTVLVVAQSPPRRKEYRRQQGQHFLHS